MAKAIFFAILLLFFAPTANAQLSGTKTIPGTYPSFVAAVLDLNAQGVGPGGVTFDIAAGYTEANVSVNLNPSTNPSIESRPIVFQKSGVGPNPVFTAPVGTSTNLDGMVILFGTDYVTFDGIDLQENPANTTATQQMEWGYALLRPTNSNGCQHNTIQNCTVTLNKANLKSVGIYSANHTNVSVSTVGVSMYQGTSSYNHFYNNTIQNCFQGIALIGHNSQYGMDIGNEIGVDGVSTRRNQIINFGGGSTGTANGINCNDQGEIQIFSTYVNNAGGAATSTTLNGIFLDGGNTVNVAVHDDTVTVSSSSASSALTGIYNDAGNAGSGNTVRIYNCLVTGCSNAAATTAIFRGIAQLGDATYTEMYGNSVINNTLAGNGNMSPIYYAGQGQTVVLDVDIHDNLVDGNTKTGSGGNLILIDANVPTYKRSIHHNVLTNNSNTGSSGTTFGYYNAAVGNLNERLYSNQINGLHGGTGETVGIKVTAGRAVELKIYDNILHDITGNTTTTVGGILADNASQGYLYGNQIYDIVNNSTIGVAASVYAIWIGNLYGQEWNLYNNVISRIQAPNLSHHAAVHAFSLFGYSNGTLGYSVIRLHHNTVFLNASSTGTDFGTRMVFMENVQNQQYELRNNLLVDLSVPNGGGKIVAIERVIANPLTNYSLSSGHNCLYAGTPASNHLIYLDGSNSDQTLQTFKDRMVPREQSSFSELPPFVNIGTAPYDLHVQTGTATQVESGGKPIALVGTDIDGTLRNSTLPDVGADEFAGIMADLASPDIRYTPLTNGAIGSARNTPLFAFVTDPSSINVSPGTKPRLYYKKSTDANAYNGNTSATDGWKYVEANNASSPFSFLLDYSLLFGGGVVAGDVVQYFVVAQDLNALPRVGISNGSFALQPASVALSATNFPIGNPQHSYLIVANAYSGTIPVGPTETITSLTNAGGLFSLLNAGVLTGNLTVEVTGDLVTETGAFALNQLAEQGGTGYTVSIVPSAAVTRLISGSNAVPGLMRMDGADRVLIDGRFNGAGRYLRLRNTSNTAPTVAFINDARHNVLRNCIVESGNTTYINANAGAIQIGITNGTQGNDSLLITENEIRDRSDLTATPLVAIFCKGTVLTPREMNNGVVISNNDIHDWYKQVSSVVQYGIYITNGNSNFTITGNSIYQTATRSFSGSSLAQVFGIQVYNPEANANSGGHLINDNFIGGTALGGTGGNMTFTSIGAVVFTGISVQTGLQPCYISNNTIRQISLTTQAGINADHFVGIYAGQGNFEIGTAGGNTIGSGTSNGSVTFNLTGTNSNFQYGFLGVDAAPVNGTANIENNVIGGWTLAGSVTTGTNGYIDIAPIRVNGTPSQDYSISGNLIGGTVPNGIHNTLAARSKFMGIYNYSNTGAKVRIDSNSVLNITSMGLQTHITGNCGIYNAGQSAGVASRTVTHNRVENLTIHGTGSYLYGINVAGNFGFGYLVTDNIVSGVQNLSTASSSDKVYGIQVSGAPKGCIVARNKIFGLGNAATGSLPEIIGLEAAYGEQWQVTNNMVSITNGTGTNSVTVIGISEYANGSSDICYNSVYIGGTNVGSHNSFAFARNLAYELNLRNNLLYNGRVGGSGLHCAVGLPNINFPNFWTSAWANYNTYITPTAAGTTGEAGTNVGQSFAQWKTVIGGDVESYADTTANVPADSLFTNKDIGDLSILSSKKYCWYVNGKGIAGTATGNEPEDFGGDARSVILGTPTDIGADEFTPALGILPIPATASAAPALGTTTSYSFAGRKLGEITWGPAGIVPAAVEWDYYSSVPPPGAIGSNINSYWDVVAAGGSGYSYDLRSYYTVHEQNQLADGLLNLGRQAGASPWYYLAGTASANVAEGKYYVRNGLNSFTRYTLGTSAPAPDFVIVASVGSGGGSISPVGSVSVTPMNDQVFAVGTTGCQVVDSVVVDGVNIGAVSSYTFTNVAANHTIQVYFSNGNFTAAASIGVSPGGTVCPGSNLTFTATVTHGGTAPSYQWQVNGGNVGSNSSTYSNATLANGDQVQCIVTSNDPCVGAPLVSSNVLTVTVQDLVPPTANCQSVTVVLDAFGNGSLAAATVDNGSSDNCGIGSLGLSQSGFSCADVGLQTVTLVVTDNAGNTATCIATVNVQSSSMTSTIVSIPGPCGYHVSCNGATDGEATVVASGGCPGYTYAWSDGQTTVGASGLAAGTYSVTVTDLGGNSTVAAVTLTAPSALQVVATTVPSCAQDSTGSIDLTVTGGNDCQSYGFQWSNGVQTEDQSGIAAGSYTVTVYDVGGCSSVQTVVVGGFAALNPTIVQNGNVLSSVQTWSSYQWLLNGVPISGANGSTYVASQSGAYSLIVTDANGCSEATAVITGLSDGRANGLGMGLYPNPARDFFRLSLEHAVEVSLEVRLSDMYGRVLLQKILAATETEMGFDIRGFAAGTYILEVSGQEGKSKQFRLVVQ